MNRPKSYKTHMFAGEAVAGAQALRKRSTLATASALIGVVALFLSFHPAKASGSFTESATVSPQHHVSDFTKSEMGTSYRSTAANEGESRDGMLSTLDSVTANGRQVDAVPNPPFVEMQFVPVGAPPYTISVGGTAQYRIKLANSNNDAITGVHFNTGAYAGAAITNSSTVSVFDNTCGGTVTADSGTSSMSLTGGLIPGLGDCLIAINVTGVGVGTASVVTGPVYSDNAPTGFLATGSIDIAANGLLGAPKITKSFAPAAIPVGEMSEMTLKLENHDSNRPILGVQISDLYPDYMYSYGSSPIIADTCDFSYLDVGGFEYPYGQSARLVGGTILAGGECSITLKVTAMQTATNCTGAVLTANSESGLMSCATLTFLTEPDLVVAKAHAGNFTRGQTGASYQLTVTNIGDWTNGSAVTVTDILPAYLTATEISGSGWACSTPPTLTCTRSEQLQFNESYPPIVVKVNVAADAPPLVTNAATVAGGGETNTSNDTANDPTTIDIVGSTTAQTIAFTSTEPNNAVVGGATYHASATATSNLPVTLAVDGASTTVCTIGAGVVSFIGAGPCTIDANQSGGMNNGTNYAPAPQVQQSFYVASAGGTAAQSITFTSAAPSDAVVGGASYHAVATATSGLPVVLTIEATAANVCAINAGVVDFIGAGTCIVDANQGGGPHNGTNYAAASEKQQSFAVASTGGTASQTITFVSPPPTTALVGGPAYPVVALASSGLPVVLTIDATSANVCTINAGTVSFVGVGPCTIDANQGGGWNNGTNYAAALQMQQAFAVAGSGGQSPQTITFTSTAPSNAPVGGPTYLATATATSSLPVVLTIDGTSALVCTINAGVVSFIGDGTCRIDANQGGGTNNGTNYAAAPQVQQSFAVGNGGGNGSGNHAPVGVGDALEVAPNSSATTLVGDANVPSSVLDNDLDADSDSLSAVKLTDPTHGTLSQFHADGTFVYQSGASAGTDSFTYKTCDAFACSPPTTVAITIGTGLHDHAPFATDDAIAVAAGATTSALIGNVHVVDSVLDNDIDPDGDVLTAFKLTEPSHGAVVLSPDVTFSYQNDDSDPVTNDSFFYAACDTKGACDAGVVTITIGAAGFADHLPVVVDDALQVALGQFADTLIGDPNDPGSVLDNDHDIDQGDILAAVKMSALLNMSGTVSLDADGTFSYQNIDQQTTSDSLIYEACDTFFACTPGIVTISINNGPLDIAPVAANDASVVAPNSSTSTLVGGATSVLANDSDPGDPLTAHLISAPANGHVTLNADGTFTYYNDDPASGVDSWEYEACDDQGACTGAAVSVTLDTAAPTVTCTLPRQLNVVGDTVAIDLSQLFAPPAGQTLVYAATNAPPSLSIAGSLLTGTLQDSDVLPPPYIYNATLTASTAGTGASASENVMFQVLPTGEILLRDGFDGGQTVQQPCQ